MNLSKKDKAGIAILGGVFITAIAILVAPMLMDRPAFDEKTLCPADVTYKRTFFVVDTTDKLDEREQRNLTGELRRVKDSLEEFERLSIYLISEEVGGASEPLFDKCAPPTGEDANALVESSRLIRRKYEKEFGAGLDEIIATVGTNDDANRSPIIESLADIANQIRRESPDWTSIRLVIFSDMLQHTNEWSHYRGVTSMDFDTFKNSRLGRSMMMDFQGTEVEILYLLRPSTPHPEAHRAFWAALLSAANAEWRWVPIT